MDDYCCIGCGIPLDRDEIKVVGIMVMCESCYAVHSKVNASEPSKYKVKMDDLLKLLEEPFVAITCEVEVENEQIEIIRDTRSSSGHYFEEELLEDGLECIGEGQADGRYWIKALLQYDKGQVGNYPPPNVEIAPHYVVEHIEFEKIEEDPNDDVIDCDLENCWG